LPKFHIFSKAEKYNIKLSKQERKMMEIWDKEDPTSEWERIKNKRIEEIQGNLNRFIE
jgi:deoxyribonuclease-1